MKFLLVSDKKKKAGEKQPQRNKDSIYPVSNTDISTVENNALTKVLKQRRNPDMLKKKISIRYSDCLGF